MASETKQEQSDIVLDSPTWENPASRELADRNFERVNAPVRSGEARQPVLPISADELRTLGSITTDVRPRLLALASALDALATAWKGCGEEFYADNLCSEYNLCRECEGKLCTAITALLSTGSRCEVATTKTDGRFDCTRQAGHDGPCAAVPRQPEDDHA